MIWYLDSILLFCSFSFIYCTIQLFSDLISIISGSLAQWDSYSSFAEMISCFSNLAEPIPKYVGEERGYWCSRREGRKGGGEEEKSITFDYKLIFNTQLN